MAPKMNVFISVISTNSKHSLAFRSVCKTGLLRLLTLQRLGGEGEPSRLPASFDDTNVSALISSMPYDFNKF